MRLPLLILLAAACLETLPALAQPAPQRQDTEVLRRQVEQFLHVQTAGLPGEVKVAAGRIDDRTALPACAAPQAFMPNGARLWGRTTVGIRCQEPSPWTIYVPATVQVVADYIVTAVPLVQGQMVGPNDVATIRGDLTRLPSGVITDASQAVGRTLSASLPVGAPLRNDQLRSVQAVLQGQTVRLVTEGPGFRVTAEGRALNNAAEGQVAQARTASGQVVSGVARTGGVVEVTY